MSINNNEPQLSKSADLLKYFKQTQKDYDTINKSLMNNVESIDSENQRLKEAIAELLSDLKEKETSLDQSQKIILKLKEEYSKMIQEYQDLKSYALTLEQAVDSNKKLADSMNKTHRQYEKSSRMNESYKVEIDKLKKEILNYKSTRTTKQNELSKKEKENNDKELMITNLKQKGESWISMVKERDRLLLQCDCQIKELNSQIGEKDEQLRLMMNFSKDINNENKTNVKELTKQAVQTIKLLYSAMNTHNNNSSNNKEDLSESVVRIDLVEDESCFKTLVDCLQNNKCSFLLEDGLKSNMYIPPNSRSVSKEFLIDMNFKSELIKYELMASLIRESQIVSFLEGILSKIDIRRYPSFDKSKPSPNTVSNEICAKMFLMKSNYEKECRRNEQLLNENQGLCDRINDLNLYIQKSKNDYQKKMIAIQKKIETLERYYQNQIKALEIGNSNTEESLIIPNRDKDNRESRDDLKMDKLFSDSQPPINNKPHERQNNYYHNKKNSLNSVNDKYSQRDNRFGILKMSQSEIFEIKPLYQYKPNSSNDYNRNISTNKNDYERHINDGSGKYPNTNNQHSQYDSRKQFEMNESFGNKQTKFNKEEKETLKDEIQRLKEEVASLLSELNQEKNKVNNSLSKKNNTIDSDYQRILDGIIALKSQIPSSQLKALTNYFINFSKELDKISSNTDDIVSNLSLAETKFAQGNQDKKIKMSYLHNIFSEMNKLFSILLSLLGRFSNDIKVNTLSLQTLFDFLEEYIYSEHPASPRFAPGQTISSQASLINQCNSILKPISNQMNQFVQLNLKVFSSSELQKYKSMYMKKTISSIIQLFKDNLDKIKREIEEYTASNHSSILESESEHNKSQFIQRYSHYTNTNKQPQHQQESKKASKQLNDELIQIKKSKRDNTIMNDIIKHFLVVNERINEVASEKQKEYNNYTEANSELSTEIYSLFEEVFHYKIDYMSDDAIFGRKLLSKLLSSLITSN